MGYRSLQDCVADLDRHGCLRRISAEIDPNLEAAAIHRRVFAAGGPALLFERVRGCRFPMVSNLFGTLDRARFMFRDSYARVQKLIELKADPSQLLRSPLRYASAPLAALNMLPRHVRSGPVLAEQPRLSELPQQVSWPRDGGPFITLPQVYTEDLHQPGLMRSNLGMYRIQLAGNQYEPDRQVGLHYQLHRTIGVHQTQALAAGRPFHVNVFVGGPPAMTLAAVMPLPEGMSELTFAGALGGRRIRMARRPQGLPVYADADFAICGTVETDAGGACRMLPEGPFGDHLGYYSLRHPFPVLRVREVFCRRGAIWPFTVVGRPPQEDTAFGQIIHDLTGPMIPSVLPGVHGVHAVDVAGVHPLLLAIGSERYMPFLQEPRPQELLTQASAILGQGQLSLAKYLWIASHQDDPRLDLHDPRAFFLHMLERADWTRDLHFQTQTTIDTLDYSGDGLNAGSKLVVAAVGPKRFDLASEMPSEVPLPAGFSDPHIAIPGVVALRGPRCPAPSFDYDASRAGRASGDAVQAAGLSEAQRERTEQIEAFCHALGPGHPLRRFRLIVIVDDPAMVAAALANMLWVAFTRSNPAADISGVDAFVQAKHWGCRGPLVIDARMKPHHAPALEEDPQVSQRIEALAAAGGPLAGLL